jgi:hypothetical protein
MPSDRILIVPQEDRVDYPLTSRDVDGEIARFFELKGVLVAVFSSRRSTRTIAKLRRWTYAVDDMQFHWSASEKKVMEGVHE